VIFLFLSAFIGIYFMDNVNAAMASATQQRL